MLAGLGGQRPPLLGEVLVHSGDVQHDLGNRLGQLGDLLPERAAVRLRLLGTREQVRPAGVRVGHRRNSGTPKPVPRNPIPTDPAMSVRRVRIDSIESVKPNAAGAEIDDQTDKSTTVPHEACDPCPCSSGHPEPHQTVETEPLPSRPPPNASSHKDVTLCRCAPCRSEAT